MNTLAQANNTVGDSFTQLRKEGKRPVDGSIIRTFKTHSILGNFEEDAQDGKTKNTEYIDYKSLNESDEMERLLGTTRYSKYSQLLDALEQAYIDKGEADDKREGRALAYEFVSRYQAAHITSDLLAAIVGDASFDSNDNHNINGQSLRQPLQLHTAEKSGINDLGNKLTESNRQYLNTIIRSNFERVSNTSVSFRTKKGEVKATPRKPINTTVGELLNSMPPFDETIQSVVELLRALPVNDIRVSYAPGGIQLEDGTIAQNYFVAGRNPDGSYSVTITNHPDEIAKSRVNYSIFLHEVLHALTIPALRQGQVDAKKKINSKEAEFYKRLVAVKRRFDSAVRSKINPETGARYKTSEVYQKTPSKLDVLEFIANLSNPKFIELAKSIPLLPKATKTKSVFRELLETIANFIRSLIGIDTNVYDSTTAILENYYNRVEETNTLLPTVTDSVSSIELEETFLSNVRRALKVSDEYDFEDNLEFMRKNYSHIIDIDTLPNRFGDTQFEVEYNDDFKALPSNEKLAILSSTMMSDLHFAYVNLPGTITTVTSGGIFTTKNLTTFIDKIFPEELNDNERNLLRSIILKAVTEKRVLDKILDNVGNADVLKTIFYEKILSQSDKSEFLSIANVNNNEAAANIIFATGNPVYDSINKVLELVKTRRNDADFIVSSVEDRSGLRYTLAKDYVLSVLRANLNKDNELVDPTNPTSSINLIQDRREIRNYIKNLVKTPGMLLPSGLSVREATKQLSNMYAELATIRSKKPKSPQDILRFNTLVGSQIPVLEDELAAITSLKEMDSLSGSSVLDKIFADIYPKFIPQSEEDIALQQEINELAEAGYIDKDNVDDELAVVSGISEYIKKYDKSFELTLSESLKDYLSHIIVGNSAISNGLAYIKTLQLAVTLDWTQSLNDPTRGISAQLTNRLNNQVNISGVDSAIIKNLRHTINQATSTSYMDGVNLSPVDGYYTGIVAFNNLNNSTYYVAYKIKENEVSNPLSLTYEELRYHKRNGKDITFSGATISTEELYNWANVDVRTFNRMFTRAEAINSVRGIMNTMGSMKETELYSATRTYQMGNTFMMQRGKSSGVAFSIKDTIEYSLFRLYENDRLKDLRTTFLNRRVNNKSMATMENGPVEEREIYIREFFSAIGFTSVVEQISFKNVEVNDMIAQIKGFLDRVDDVPSYNLLGEIEEEVSAFTDWVDGSAANGVSGYITRFSDLLGRSDDLLRNPSIRDLKGNKFYKYHDSSWAYDVLNNLNALSKSNSVYRGGTGADNLRLVPEFLTTSMYNNNIFVRNSVNKVKNKIYTIGEFEGAKNLDNDSVTPYTRENMYYFYHRLFLQGFLDGARQYGDSYFHFTYIPSDKPKHPILRLGILSDNSSEGVSDVTLGIETALHQILETKKYGSQIEIASFKASVEKDLFRNFQLAKEAIKQLGIEFNEENISAIAKKVSELMSDEASKLLDELISDQVQLTFDKRTYTYMRKLRSKLNQSFPINEEMLAGGNRLKDENFKSRKDGAYSVNKADILPLFDLFFKNNYVNGYFANQIIAGDYMTYKKDSSDIVKRYAGVFAPGIKGLVDPNIGMKPTYKVLVLSDTLELTGANKESYDALESGKENTTRGKLLELFYGGVEPTGQEAKNFEDLMNFFGDSFESTDAQGFILPSRQTELSRGFERNWGLGQVHKPVHFEIKKYSVKDENGDEIYSTGIPYYTKYSAIVLDDALVLRYPMLGKLRKVAERMGADEILFNSAVKEGMPIVRNEKGELHKNGKSFSFRDIINVADIQDVDEYEATISAMNRFTNPPIIELSNSNYRLQHNPQADPTKGVSLFTQVIYFLNVYADELSSGNYATTQDAAQEVYSLIGELIGMGRTKFADEIGNGTDIRKFETYLKKKFDGPGAERALELIQNGISVNHPLLEKRAVISLASGMEKATVKIKLPGGKLVLQSVEGILNTKVPQLEYRFEELNDKRILVADCIVPQSLLTKEQRQALDMGKYIYALPDLLGFRIPSTELHSAVALRIKGIYNDKNTNVIIVPKELVPIHGSDQPRFDSIVI